MSVQPTGWSKCVPVHVAFLVVYVAVPLCHFGLLRGPGVAALSRGIYSLLFMAHSQVSHLQASCMAGSDDWYAHQVMTSTNHGCENRLETFLSGGLNYQIEHHLFPGVNHCHHPALRKIVRRACRDRVGPERKINCHRHWNGTVQIVVGQAIEWANQLQMVCGKR